MYLTDGVQGQGTSRCPSASGAPHEELKKLLDEKSILLRMPEEGLIIGDTQTLRK